MHLAPGASSTTTVDLAADHDLSRAGAYSVRLASDQTRVSDSAVTVRNNRPALTVAALRPSSAEFRSGAGVTASATWASARRAASASGSASGARVTVAASGVWFGSFSSSRYSHIVSAMSNIRAELTGKVVTFDRSQPVDAMAYVQPNAPYTIYICSGYWPAAALGYDSKAGTLVHESSHFLVNGGAADVVYGLAAGRRLATRHPNSAVRNADNIEHFTESL
ncbi:MAG TPA: M35 family metallo-endopeptidase [Kineosporiaceae bacterium]|nr:M35 family metallo-endopeptidase [Kineosporiaceae bacterium]